MITHQPCPLKIYPQTAMSICYLWPNLRIPLPYLWILRWLPIIFSIKFSLLRMASVQALPSSQASPSSLAAVIPNWIEFPTALRLHFCFSLCEMFSPPSPPIHHPWSLPWPSSPHPHSPSVWLNGPFSMFPQRFPSGLSCCVEITHLGVHFLYSTISSQPMYPL